jgi:hypothetical protein
MHPENEHDPLSELLSGVELPSVNSMHREAVFLQTCGVLRRRRLLRQCSWIAALASCWAVGVFSTLAWQSVWPPGHVAAQPGDGAIENRAPTPTKQPALPTEPSDPGRLTEEAPTVIARSEIADSLTTFEKMRRAGDRQLNERGNMQGAIGCYRRALDYASDDDLQIVPQRDSWLLISLKEARLENRKHVHKKS